MIARICDLCPEFGPWGCKYSAIIRSWCRTRGDIVPFYASSTKSAQDLLRHHSIETSNAKLHSAVQARGHFPNDDAAVNLLFPVLHLTEMDLKVPTRKWSMTKAQSAILFGERFMPAMAKSSTINRPPAQEIPGNPRSPRCRKKSNLNRESLDHDGPSSAEGHDRQSEMQFHKEPSPRLFCQTE